MSLKEALFPDLQMAHPDSLSVEAAVAFSGLEGIGWKAVWVFLLSAEWFVSLILQARWESAEAHGWENACQVKESHPPEDKLEFILLLWS